MTEENVNQNHSALSLRQQAEEKLRRAEAQTSESLSPEETRLTLYELRVHQIELEMQNDELHRAQVELEDARAHYFDFYNLAPVGFCTISEQGLILEANLTAAVSLDVTRRDLTRQPITRFIFKEDQDSFYLYRQQLFETGMPQVRELRMLKKDGSQFWAHLEANVVQDADGGAPTCRIALSDITERALAEEAMSESEGRFRALFDNSIDGVALHEIILNDLGEPVDYIFLMANPSFEVHTGLRVADILGKRATQIHPGIEKTDLIKIYGKVALTGEPASFETFFEPAQKYYSIAAYQADKGRFAVVFENITDRKRAEVALAQQNVTLSKLNQFSIGLSTLSAEDNLEAFIARQIKEITGASVAVFSEYNPADRTITTKHIEMEPGLLEKVVGLLGKQFNKVHIDVSDEVYREMTTEFIGVRKTLYEASFGGISRPVGAAIKALLKVDRFIGIAYLVEGKLYGTSMLAMSAGQPDPPRNILENFVSLAAVSLRRRQSDLALSASEARFRSFFDDSPISLWEEDFSAVKRRLDDLRADGVVDFDAYLSQHPEVVAECSALIKVLDVNKATLGLYGAVSKEHLLKNIESILPKAGSEYLRAELALIASDANQFEMKMINQTLDGKMITVTLNWAVIPGYESDLSRIIVSLIDITERERAEQEREMLAEIMQGLAGAQDLKNFLSLVHHSIAKVIYAENFFVILYNTETALFEEVYSVDKFDPPAPPSQLENSICSYVFRTGQPFLSTPARFDELEMQSEVKLVGTNSASWLGVPLKVSSESIGVIVVQDYDHPKRYSERDMEFLSSIAGQVALAVERMRAEQALKESHDRMVLVFDSIPADVYLADIQTYEILFMNQHMRDSFGENLVGQICWRAFRGASEPCAHCTKVQNDQMVDAQGNLTGVVTWEGQNPLTRHWYTNYDRTVRWTDGRLARMQIAVDITERVLADETLKESEKRYRSLFDSMMDGVYRSTHAGKFVDVNPAMLKMFGYSSREEMLAADIKKDLYFASEDRDTHFMDTGREEIDTFRMRRKDGSEIWVEDHESFVFDEQGAILYHEGTLRDITGRKQAEEALQAAETNFRSIFENATVGIYQSIPQGRFLRVNPVMARVFGYDSPEEMLTSIASIEEQYYVDPADRHEIQRLLMEQGEVREFISLNRCKDGRHIWVQENARAVKDASGSILYYDGFITDITERKQAEDELSRAKGALENTHKELEQAYARERHLAHIDELTGVNNRRSLVELAEREFNVATRYRHPFSVMMFDIDYFKGVNDTFGHAVGDQVLQRVTQIASAELRSVDVIGRYGGEEFVIMLPVTDAQQVYPVAERIRAGVKALRVPTPKGDVAVTISIGIAEIILAPQDESVDKVIRRADEAMYEAKHAGRNRTVIFDPK